MKTEIQKSAKSQVEIKCEVSAEEFQIFRERAVLKLGENVEVEGFRKGKAPKEAVEKQLDKTKKCKNETYPKNKIDPIFDFAFFHNIVKNYSQKKINQKPY